MRLRRHAGEPDNAAIDRLRQAVRDVDGEVWLPGPDDAEPAEACWIAEEAGLVVGMTGVVHWVEDDGTEVFLVAGCVDPPYRGRGYGTAMLRRQESYVASLKSATAGAVLAGNADDSQPDAQQLLIDNGYRPVFTVVQLTRGIGVADDEIPALPGALEVRPVMPTHQPKIHATIDQCFRGRGHGFRPLDYPGYLAAVRDTDLWIVAWDDDEVAGLVTNERQSDGSVDSPWVAVRPTYRRRGLATALLKQSFAM